LPVPMMVFLNRGPRTVFAAMDLLAQSEHASGTQRYLLLG